MRSLRRTFATFGVLRSLDWAGGVISSRAPEQPSRRWYGPRPPACTSDEVADQEVQGFQAVGARPDGSGGEGGQSAVYVEKPALPQCAVTI